MLGLSWKREETAVGKAADSESDYNFLILRFSDLINHGLKLQMWISPLVLLMGYHRLESKLTQFPTRRVHPFDSICNSSFSRLSGTQQATYLNFRTDQQL